MVAGSLTGRVALVAGATRGGGRAIALELAIAGATVYATGRSTTDARSPMDRAETIEETAAMAEAAGGRAIAVVVDHHDAAQVRSLVDRIEREQGRLDILVDSLWGGDPMTQWGPRLWEHDLEQDLRLLRHAVETHIITSHAVLGLLSARPGGLVVEVTDGNSARYRGTYVYDLVKSSIIRMAVAQAAELAPLGCTALAITPGFLRSEAMLDHFGVTELTWRDALAADPHFVASETPRLLGRAVAALAADTDVGRFAGRALSTWQLGPIYELTDIDGSRPDWGRYWRENLEDSLGPLGDPL